MHDSLRQTEEGEGGTLSVTAAARSDINRVFPLDKWNIHRIKP